MVNKNKNFIQFLGTGAADFFEVHVRECSEGNCAKAKKLGGRNLRHAPSLFISPDVLVDFYSKEQMRNYGIRDESIHHLLITHSHYDHFQPVAILDFASSLPHPLSVYGNMTVKNALDFATVYRWDASVGLFKMNQNNSKIQVRAISPRESFSLGETKVTPVLANHKIDRKHLILTQQSLNYVVERGGKALFYGLDSGYILPETLKILSKFQFDIAIFEATFGHLEIDPPVSGHQNFSMLEKTVAQFRQANLFKKETVIVADHISQHHVEPYNEIVAELSKKGIILAYDGMILEF
ncbi:MAG: MBL fold metallo-hydrolase [Candidatus Hodarchaeota archaeon]